MKIRIHTQILIAMVLGVVAGLVFKERTAAIKIVGDLFIRLLKMIIIPLITASMVSGVISIGNVRALGRIGLRTFAYYLATTLIAVSVGLVLVNTLRPGDGFEMPAAGEVEIAEHEPPTVGSILNDIVPDNIINAAAGSKFLSVIFFSLVIGVAINLTGEKARPLAGFFEALNAVMLRITGWIMRLAPLGVFALMAYIVGTLGLQVIGDLARYIATVLLGLMVHACVVLPLLLLFLAGYSPLRFFRHMFAAVATAFSTASSAATLPVTMECLEENAGVSNKVASFVLPLGATINMDGTALYEAVAAMFIAQAYSIDMTLGHQLIIMLTATLASIGAAAIPSAGLITMVIVLNAVGLPAEGIAVIFAVDRVLDMFRTGVNVWGDACGAAVVARFEGEKLA